MAPLSPNPDGLAELDRRVARDLEMLQLPANWIVPTPGPDGTEIPDVVVIGAGMYGIAAAGALILKGIRNIRVLDRAEDGLEGPWVTYARMETLRSSKHLPGPCLGIPALTFRSWYEAAFGTAAWEALYKIPNADWQDYLTWLRHRLALPLTSRTDVVGLDPDATGVTLRLADGSRLRTRRVVLATGRVGTGGPAIPHGVAADLWPDRAAHSSEAIDFARLAGRRIAVLGAGASAWDNAATALEQGAARVDLYCRRESLPQINKSRAAANPGFYFGWGGLAPEQRWELFRYLQDNQAPPPFETVNRTIALAGFNLHFGTPVRSVTRTADGVALATGRGVETADFLIVGTGFRVDLSGEPMLAPLAGRIATWGQKLPAAGAPGQEGLAPFPWLGDGFELTDLSGDAASPLGRIHLFNHAAAASLGAIASDVPGVNAGADRLAFGLVNRFFAEDVANARAALLAFAEAELEPTPYCTLPRPETVP